MKSHSKKQNLKKDKIKEAKVYGLNACIAFAKHRPDKILRAYYTQAVAKHFFDLQKYLAKNKKVYRVVKEEDLEKLSQSQHHEGVFFAIQTESEVSVVKWLAAEKKKQSSVLLVLENIRNPHNLGAILRIAAHFGVSAIASKDPKSLMSGAALRTAEGGAEHVPIVGYSNLKEFIAQLKRESYQILTTSSHNGTSIYDYHFSQKTALLFGEEGDGLSKEAFLLEDNRLVIPGTGNVESLNVSVAISVILGEIWRKVNKG